VRTSSNIDTRHDVDFFPDRLEKTTLFHKNIFFQRGPADRLRAVHDIQAQGVRRSPDNVHVWISRGGAGEHNAHGKGETLSRPSRLAHRAAAAAAAAASASAIVVRSNLPRFFSFYREGVFRRRVHLLRSFPPTFDAPLLLWYTIQASTLRSPRVILVCATSCNFSTPQPAHTLLGWLPCCGLTSVQFNSCADRRNLLLLSLALRVRPATFKKRTKHSFRPASDIFLAPSASAAGTARSFAAGGPVNPLAHTVSKQQ